MEGGTRDRVQDSDASTLTAVTLILNKENSNTTQEKGK